MKSLDETLAEFEERQRVREQHPTAVTTHDCRNMVAALRYAADPKAVGDMYPDPNRIAAILRGDPTP